MKICKFSKLYTKIRCVEAHHYLLSFLIRKISHMLSNHWLYYHLLAHIVTIAFASYMSHNIAAIKPFLPNSTDYLYRFTVTCLVIEPIHWLTFPMWHNYTARRSLSLSKPCTLALTVVSHSTRCYEWEHHQHVTHIVLVPYHSAPPSGCNFWLAVKKLLKIFHRPRSPGIVVVQIAKLGNSIVHGARSVNSWKSCFLDRAFASTGIQVALREG